MERTNSIELKYMVPTLTLDGIVPTWSLGPVPVASTTDAVPFTLCRDVTFDDTFGCTMVDGHTVAAVRVLILTQDAGDDEETGTYDSGRLGLRVVRKARCGLAEPDESAFHGPYIFKTAGTTPEVQWLLTAPHNQAFLVTAKMVKGIGDVQAAFNVLSCKRVSPELFPQFKKLMRDTLQRGDSVLQPDPAATLMKRLDCVIAATTASSAVVDFAERRRFQEAGATASRNSLNRRH